MAAERTRLRASSSANAPAPPTRAAENAASGHPTSAVEPAAPTTLSETAAREFVARWEAAQNSADFAAYEQLYAERFSGLKRIGGYTARFDRVGWLRDRKPMLRSGVSVHVSDLTLSSVPGFTRAVFTQEFRAKGFRDIGRKQLLLTSERAGTVISREEMLESRVDPEAKTTTSVMGFHRDGPVVERGASADQVDGEPRLLLRGPSGAFEVSAKPKLQSLSPAARAWIGREVAVYNATNGAVCTARIARLELRIKAEPHFGMRQAWDGEDGAPKALPRAIAQQIWDIARDDERFVVGVLDQPCHGDFATERALPWVSATTASAPIEAAAVRAFKALPRYHELQQQFARESADQQHAWEAIDGELRVVELRAADARFVIVSARGGAGCAGFSGSLSAIWTATGDTPQPHLNLRDVLDTGELLQVRGAVDLDGDGDFEFLTGPEAANDEFSVLRPRGRKYERELLFWTAFWDCGC